MGARGGASVASTSATDESGAKSRTGLAVGVFLEAPVSTALAVQVEGAYVQKGAAWDAGTVEFNYVDFGVLLKAGTSAMPSLYAFAGPTLGLNVACRVRARSAGAELSLECDDLDDRLRAERATFGAKGGVGAAMRVGESVRLSLDVAYALDLTDAVEGSDAKNRGFLIQAGAAIPLG